MWVDATLDFDFQGHFGGQIRSKIGFKLIKTGFGARRSGFIPSELILLFKEVIFLELMTQTLFIYI